MRWNKRLLVLSKLYLILDAQVLPYDTLLHVLKDAVRAGIDVVQLRDKRGSARGILDFCAKALAITKHQVPLIVNDRVDLALIAGADGVHLGQEDIAFEDARRILGPDALIGVSCQSTEHLLQAQRQGADYVGFGSVFATQTKPERQPMDLALLREALREASLPLFAIGGISRQNIDPLIALGVHRVAVCRDILLDSDPQEVVKALKHCLDITRG